MGFDFQHNTPRILCAPGALSRLGEVTQGASRVLVVLDPAFAGGAVEARARAALGAAAVFVHAVPNHEPTAESVTACALALRESGAGALVAIGGGSVLDTAKAARGLAANPGPLADLLGPGREGMAAHASIFIAMPSTAGTGSEVSDSAIVDMPGTIYKAVMRAPHLAPAVALLDAEITLTAPAHVTAASGYDALTHAVEAATSRASSPLTEPLALDAVATLARHLPRAVAAPDDLAAREACLVASTQAGIAFNSAHLGLAHAVAGALGALHHVPHGLANAIALPWTMAFNAGHYGPEREARLAAALSAERVPLGLARLRAKVGLDRGLDEFVPDAAARDRLAEAAMTSGQVAMNPRPAALADMRALLEAMRHPLDGAEPRWPSA
ncbi:MAG: iron-containing alcohol dehydrogenase [Rhodobacteraceae bacterium]|nr:iron-containing alcohol dehydrogenase [Paracoccaceae bacterium]